MTIMLGSPRLRAGRQFAPGREIYLLRSYAPFINTLNCYAFASNAINRKKSDAAWIRVAPQMLSDFIIR